MCRYSNFKICFIAVLLLVFSTGCNDPDKSAGAIKGLTPPTVTSVAPPNGTIGACPNTIVTATFSEAMNPATITSATFTITGPASASVMGAVTYDAPSDTAIFTPSSTLALSTAYTATITTGAKDSFGNALASNFVWTFTTGNTVCQCCISRRYCRKREPICSGSLAQRMLRNVISASASFIVKTAASERVLAALVRRKCWAIGISIDYASYHIR